jgi:Putative Actinobacterial Holin-X, holin superfamily III
MVRSGRPGGADGQQSLGELVAQAAQDISALVRYEIRLATKELKIDGLRVAVAAALGVVALFVICLMLILLCFAYAYGLMAAGLWDWVAFIVVAFTCLLFAVAAALVARWFIGRFSGLKLTRQTVIDDLSMLRRSEPSPNGSGPAVANPEVSVGTTAAEIPPARS